jgi:hypothetical protein
MTWTFKKKEELHPWPPVRSDAWPKFVDGKRPVLCRPHPNDNERVCLVERPDGNFTSVYEYFSGHEYEMCWIGSGCSRIYDSAETAAQEIHIEFPRAKKIVPQKRAEHVNARDGLNGRPDYRVSVLRNNEFGFNSL